MNSLATSATVSVTSFRTRPHCPHIRYSLWQRKAILLILAFLPPGSSGLAQPRVPMLKVGVAVTKVQSL
jgi:hypothetical protein